MGTGEVGKNGTNNVDSNKGILHGRNCNIITTVRYIQVPFAFQWDNSWKIWKHDYLKMHLIDLTYEMSQLATQETVGYHWVHYW